MKKCLAIFTLIFITLSAFAQRVEISAPKSTVGVGENFQIKYIIHNADVRDIRLGNLPDEIEEIYSAKSSQQSISYSGSKVDRSSTTIYTFTLIAQNSGSFTIPPAHIITSDKNITTASVKINVGGGRSNPSNSQQSSGPKFHEEDDQPQDGMKDAGTPVTNSDLFIKVSANKTHVYEQEPILLTYKVYTQVNLTQLNGKMPDLNGFHSQEVELPQQKTFHNEIVNGRNYRCVTWSQYVMYPQMTGKLEIPSITFEGIVAQRVRNADPIEIFFNGGSGYTEVRRDIVAPGITIQVDSLPAKPANFSGGVGKLNISAQLEKQEAKAGDPIKLRVVVGGTGNLKLIKQPEVNFPKDFDVYDPEVTDKTGMSASGVEGNMIYDFIAVPRKAGEYNIPEISLTYFDTETKSYKTVKTQSFTLKVTPGDGSGADSDYADTKNQDIRQIKRGEPQYVGDGNFFYSSTAYWFWILVPLALFLALLAIFRKRAIDNADIIKVKARNANKVATKRLRTANRLMLKGENGLFYDEVLKALWGYVGDKLNMPEEQLSRDNVSERLAEHGVGQETVDKFIEALDECEFERYAPGDAKGNMNKTFESAMTAIMDIENAMKTNSKKTKAAVTILLLAVCCQTFAANPTKENADAEYLKGNYQQAISEYEMLLKKQQSPDILYNLGNAYYRTDNITKAILNYERAKLLDPGDRDIQFNLQFVRSKTIDKFDYEAEGLLQNWYEDLVNFTSVDRWAYMAVISIILVLILLMMYLFADRILLRKIGFFGALAFLFVFILANVFAFQQKKRLELRDGAIVTASSVDVKKSPADTSDTAFVIHEGTKVIIKDFSIKGWNEVKIADGRIGWLKSADIEKI